MKKQVIEMNKVYRMLKCKTQRHLLELANMAVYAEKAKELDLEKTNRDADRVKP